MSRPRSNAGGLVHALAAITLVGCGNVVETVDAPMGLCMPADCSDNDMCTTDFCAQSNTCTYTQVDCDDADPCTVDACDALTGCSHTPVNPTGTMTFDFNGAIQTFVVPQCETSIRVSASGAQGGLSNGQQGGRGATIAGDFAVTSGQGISVLVGGAGIAGSTTEASQRGGSGGGGSFVVSGTTILVVAGGGGGAIGGLTFGTAPGGPGQITTAGQAGEPAGPAGGINGGGGTTNPNTIYHGGTGGGGYSGDGVGNSVGSSTYGTANTPGRAFANGGAAGAGGTQGHNGGFGGGGSAGYCGGGGGGYSGGGAGNNVLTGQTAPTNGGGGGSINLGASQTNQVGARNGNGQVVITW